MAGAQRTKLSQVRFKVVSDSLSFYFVHGPATLGQGFSYSLALNSSSAVSVRSLFVNFPYGLRVLSFKGMQRLHASQYRPFWRHSPWFADAKLHSPA